MRKFVVIEKTVCGGCGGSGRLQGESWRNYVPALAVPVCVACGGSGELLSHVPLREALDEIGLATVLQHWIGAPGEGCGS